MSENYDIYLDRLPQVRITRGSPRDLLRTRADLLAAAELIETDTLGAGRAMTEDEQRNMDRYLAGIRTLNERLSEYKRQREAENDSGLPLHFPF
jgi:hypothetical protein